MPLQPPASPRLPTAMWHISAAWCVPTLSFTGTATTLPVWTEGSADRRPPWINGVRARLHLPARREILRAAESGSPARRVVLMAWSSEGNAGSSASWRPRPFPSWHPSTKLLAMRVGDILRDSLPKNSSVPTIDGYPNLYFVTASPDGGMIPFSAGINRMRPTSGAYSRRPALLIRSSPHKAGSIITPWQDRFEPDRGHIRYFGDNKY